MDMQMISGLALIAFSIYTYYTSQDMNMVTNGKVWGGGAFGALTIMYNIYKKLPLLLKSPDKQETQPEPKPEVKPEVKPEIKPEPENEEDDMNEKLADFDVNELEKEDIRCLNYLMKRGQKLTNKEIIALLKQLNDKFFDVHSGVTNEQVK